MEEDGLQNVSAFTSNNLRHLDNLTQEENLDSLLILYEIGVPSLIFLSVLSFLINGVILLAILTSKNLLSFSSSNSYLLLITSLVGSDMLTSLLLGGGLLFGSYLPIVFNMVFPMCFMLGKECIRLSLVLTTILHLLFMVLLHAAGVSFPVKLKIVVTSKFIFISILLMWFLPILVLIIIFSSVSNELFMSENCAEVSILQTFAFRAYFVSAIFGPLAVITITYSYFHYVLSKRFNLSRSSRSIQRQNIRVAGITFLILLSCLFCWLPASVIHLVICPDGCLLSHLDIHPLTMFVLHASGNFMLIIKSIINPLIFAMRHKEVRRSVNRFIKCETEKRRGRLSEKHVKYSMHSRTPIL